MSTRTAETALREWVRPRGVEWREHFQRAYSYPGTTMSDLASDVCAELAADVWTALDHCSDRFKTGALLLPPAVTTVLAHAQTGHR